MKRKSKPRAKKSKGKKVKRVVRALFAKKAKTKRRSKKHWFNFDLKGMKHTWVLPALLVTLVVGLFLKPTGKYPTLHTSAKLQAMFEKAHTKNADERVAFWSKELYKNPQLLSSVSPGPKVNDTAPLFPQHYDCTTYVETVGALARSRNAAELGEKIIKIRYRGGEVSYFTRNHFPEADWIPNNESAGILEDITKDVAAKANLETAVAKKRIDKLAWFKTQKVRLGDRVIATSAKHRAEDVEVNYIPLDKVTAALQHIPQGAIVNVVREDKRNKPVLISHQGFLVWKDGKAFFRHASREKQISEQPFDDYLSSMTKMPWRVVGVNINAYNI